MDPSPLHPISWIKPSYHQGWRSTKYVVVYMLTRGRRWSSREESRPLPYGGPSFGGKLGPLVICCFPLSLLTWCCMKLLRRALQSLRIAREPSKENTTSIQGPKKCFGVCFMASLGFGGSGAQQVLVSGDPRVWPPLAPPLL